jgi:hypothetical protein
MTNARIAAPIGVLLLALLVRGSVLLMPGALEKDPDGYRQLAENLVEHGTLGTDNTPSAYRSPLYPLSLTGCVALGDGSREAIGLLHLLLGVATVALVLVLGHWWGLGSRGAALAALLVACDPILLSQSTQVMTETLAAFLATAGLVVLTWASRDPSAGRALLAGGVLALGALCRSTLLLWAIVVGAVLVYQRWRAADFQRRHLQTSGDRPPNRSATAVARNVLVMPAAFALGALLVLSPWAIRNQLQFGRPVATATIGGSALLLANNPEFYQWLRTGPWGSVWQADRFWAAWDRRKPADELQTDRLAYAEAWQNIRREPGTFAYACLVRVGRFWSPLPHRVVDNETPLRRLARWAVAAWYVAVFTFAAIGAWRIVTLSKHQRRRIAGEENRGEWRVASGESSVHHSATINRPGPPSVFPFPLSPSCWCWGLWLVVCLTAVHTLFWSDMRMRAPVMVVVALAAASSWFAAAPQKK